MEKHGKTLSAEGKVLKGAPLSDYEGPALKEQSVSKDKGPPEIQENEKKSDAYEVVNDGDDNDHDTHETASSEDETLRVVKVGSHRGRNAFRMHASDSLDSMTGHHRSGLHIVSLDGDDADKNAFGDKDTRLYASIGSLASSPVRHRSHFRPRQRGSYYANDFPPNVISVSQDELNGGLSQRDEGQTREEMFPIFRRRNPLSFSQSSQLTQPEELMQPFQPVNTKSISVGGRPDMFLLPLFNGRADSNPPLVPITAQNAFPASPLGATPIGYSSPPPTGTLNNQLLLQPAVQVPMLQTPSPNPTFIMPSGQFPFDSQQPDARSLYELQSQPQLQIPQVPMSQFTQPQQLIIPAQMQITPELLSSSNERVMGPTSRWVDEDGRPRSEVLGHQRDRHDEERLPDERGEEDDDYEEGRHESSRYYDRDEDSRREDESSEEEEQSHYPPKQSYSQDEEAPSEEEGEDADQPEEEPSEDAMGRSYGTNDPSTEDEDSPDSSPPENDDSDDQEVPPAQDGFATQRNPQQFNPQLMQRFMPANRPFNFPNQMDAQTFARYQLTSPSSALKEHILPKPQEPKTHTNILGDPNVKISQMSSAEAEFLENEATLEPNFAPPIASKDTIPRKSRRFRFGLGNVLIRLNGKPLEDSSQLRSKIINGQIVQGKGKLIKSKGPVRVKLSHTKDAKHLKIIDIIAPKQFHVYDTKSNIGRLPKVSFGASKTNTTMAPFFANRLKTTLDNMV